MSLDIQAIGQPSFVPFFFERYFERYTEEPMSGCWLWHASQTTAGYGNFTYEGETLYAHRCSFESEHGEGSAIGIVVRHRCDTPPCINPAHLIGGNQAENIDDAWRRGRMAPAFGQDHVRAIVTEEHVIEMRRLATSNHSIHEIQALFPMIKRNAVDAAITGKSWAHLPGAVPLAKIKKQTPRYNPLKGSNSPVAILTEEAVREIKCELAAKTTPRRVLAARHGVSLNTIHSIAAGRNWAHV
ncbi:MAG: hypothetical protein EOS58_31730 [Mesorhizobium sp.]|nr:MAG: hypothetical protein EOS58_31730 [Mesorhizobium sp.]